MIHIYAIIILFSAVSGLLRSTNFNSNNKPPENRLSDTVSYILLAGWLYGDPHIRTLDGLQYTFNGLGEYTLLQTTDGNFTLQGRTVRALDANGTQTMATVYGAFAAKDALSDRLHAEMTSSRDGMMMVLVDSLPNLK